MLSPFLQSIFKNALTKQAATKVLSSSGKEAATSVAQDVVSDSRKPQTELPSNLVTERYDAYGTQGSRGFLRALGAATDRDMEVDLPSREELDLLFDLEVSRNPDPSGEPVVTTPQTMYDTPDVPVLGIPYWGADERKGVRRFKRLQDGRVVDITTREDFGSLGEEHPTNRFNNWANSVLVEPIGDFAKTMDRTIKEARVKEALAVQDRIRSLVEFMTEKDRATSEQKEFEKKRDAARVRKSHST